jgi:hypothetical protein
VPRGVVIVDNNSFCCERFTYDHTDDDDSIDARNDDPDDDDMYNDTANDDTDNDTRPQTTPSECNIVDHEVSARITELFQFKWCRAGSPRLKRGGSTAVGGGL